MSPTTGGARLRRAAVILLVAMMAGAAVAAPVTLTTSDGTVTLHGRLLGFDGEVYRLGTDGTTLAVDAGHVTCTGAACPQGPPPARLRMQGPPELAERLMPGLIGAFALSRGLKVARARPAPGVLRITLADGDGRGRAVFTLRGSDTGAAFAALAAGQAELALATRPPSAQERRAMRAAGRGDPADPALSRRIGRDVLVPVTAPGSTLRSLDLGALSRRLQGRGGAGTVRLARSPAMAPGSALSEQLVADAVRPVRRFARAGALARAVAATPGALAVTAKSLAGAARVVTLEDDCGHILPVTPAAIRAGDTPLALDYRLHFSVTPLPPLGREFLRFLDGPLAWRVVESAGLISERIRATPLDAQGGRLADAIMAADNAVPLAETRRMARILAGAARLSLDLRFAPGESTPDATARHELARLAAAIDAGAYEGRAFIVAGFSDGQGPWQMNREVAGERAEAVRAGLLARLLRTDPASVTIRAEAFGEALPMACDNADWGRRINRRVEIWVR